MENEIIINVGIKDYKCYKKLEGNNSNKEYINDKLLFLRNTVSQMKYSTGENLVECDVYVYESNEINAFSSKIVGGYAIALSSGMFLGFNTELESYLRNEDIRRYFYGKKVSIKKHVKKIIDYILLYTVLHENYHILNGHCDTYYSQKAMVECLVKGNPENNRFNQILELDADFCAVRSLTYLIKERKFEAGVEKIEFILMGFSLYYIFLKFQEMCYENMHALCEDMSIYSHPPASTRIVYAFMVIATYLATNYRNIFDYLIELNSLSELCIYFDRIYYDSETMDLTLIAFGYTKRGMDYLEGLHNEWNEVKKLLEPNAFIKLRTNESLNISNMYFLDGEGKFIPEKVNSNIERLMQTIGI